jgi:hypothetical protein
MKQPAQPACFALLAQSAPIARAEVKNTWRTIQKYLRRQDLETQKDVHSAARTEPPVFKSTSAVVGI